MNTVWIRAQDEILIRARTNDVDGGMARRIPGWAEIGLASGACRW